MLIRVYVNNFRAFVNFECKFGPIELILGTNGTGKSSLFLMLDRLQLFAHVGLSSEKCFFHSELTRWQKVAAQEFELDVRLDQSLYQYRLSLEMLPRAHPRVLSERVYVDGSPVFQFVDGEVGLFDDQHQRKVAYPFDPHRSALATVVARPDNTKLTRFKNWLANLSVVQIDPPRMSAHSDSENAVPLPTLANFASWVRHLVQEDPAEFQILQKELSEVVPGLRALAPKFMGGNHRYLVAQFDAPAGQSFEFGIDELSDGQRALIALYTVLRFRLRRGCTLLIDEPDNFVALREIQPWLTKLMSKVDGDEGQALIASHHPELLNQLAAEHGRVFRRDGQGPIRVDRFRTDESGTLTPAEVVSRGWDA